MKNLNTRTKFCSRYAAGLIGAGFCLLAAPSFAADAVSDPLSALERGTPTYAQQAMVQNCLSDTSSSRAVRACTKFIRQAVPNNEVRANLHMRRGLHQLALGRFDKAGADFNQASELNNNDDFARLGQGFVAVMEDDWQTARTKFEDCANYDGTASLAVYGIGLTYQMSGDAQAARAAYERALDMRPGWQAVTAQLETL